jgi:hypothetical protein
VPMEVGSAALASSRRACGDPGLERLVAVSRAIVNTSEIEEGGESGGGGNRELWNEE